MEQQVTTFKEIYNMFLGRITDDMYMEWTEEDTLKDLKNIFLDAIAGFEFPRFDLYDFNLEEETYNIQLTLEEQGIIALLMYNSWLQRQIASIENTRMKYSGSSDFKFTSQANHLAKLITLKQEAERQDLHKQRLYKRRDTTNTKGTIQSNWLNLLGKSVFDDLG